MYSYKYQKYKYLKDKIQNSMIQIGGIGANKIILDGTSSVGKTSISKYFEKNGYIKIAYDDYRKEGRNEFFRTVPNEYMSKKEFKQAIEYKIRDLMYEESKKYPKVIFDVIDLSILNIDKTIFVVIVYAPLEDTIRNMLSRQLIEYRTPSDVFQHFVDRYVKSDTYENSIDIINRKKFIKQLGQMKYEFESENQLLKVAEKMFADMGIYDDDDHPIKFRGNYKADYIINTHNKTPKEIYDEIKLAADKYDK